MAGLVASAVGLAISAFLVAAGSGEPAATASAAGGTAGLWASVPFCGPGSACRTLWASPYGRMLGFPLAGWGVLAYVALAIGGALWATGAWRGSWLVPGGVVALSWAAAGFAVYLVVLQGAVFRAVCPWCLVADGAGLVSAIAYTAAARTELAQSRGRPGVAARKVGASGGRGHGGSRDRILAAKQPTRWRAMALPAATGVVAAVALSVTHWVMAGSASQPLQPSTLAAGAAVASLPERLDQLEALMSAGPPEAPARVDVYSDFQCPYCALAAVEVIAPLMAQDVAEGRMRIVFHNFAFLGAESRWAAQAAVCAAVQGRFWPFHDRLFSQLKGKDVGTFRPERLVEMAREEGLQVDAFRSCLQQPSVGTLVEASYREGVRRGVQGTPTFFVNGRMVEGLVPVDVIRQLAYGTGR